jgi:hypothetical protein
MHFEDTFRIFAFPPSLVDDLPGLIADYGVNGTLNRKPVRTIAAGWDDVEHTRKRPLTFPETASLTLLTDGWVAYNAMWSLALVAAKAAGTDPMLSEAKELTEEQFEELRHVPEEMQ